MGKGAARFGGKSGFLPKPRDIFKQPYKQVVYQKEPDTGYADGILHPRGTTRDLIQNGRRAARKHQTGRAPQKVSCRVVPDRGGPFGEAGGPGAPPRRGAGQGGAGRARVQGVARRGVHDADRRELFGWSVHTAAHRGGEGGAETEAGGEPAGAGAGAEAGAGGEAAGTVQCGGEFRRDGGKTQGDGGQCVLGQKAAGGEGHAERGSERSGLATKLGRVRQDGCGRDSGHREQGSVAGRCGGHAERLQRDDAGGGADEDGGEEDGAEAEGGGEAETAAAAAGGDSSRAGAEARGG
ncbi:hypothetical protein KL942_003115 [Ogataea angusta]|uniref:Uncharacterized protein n=1 Tax=Pichia angusta TaxID=870730 RepID=A0ABQ7RQN5_PICAN|nr:hypothetical protein KL942_003115 [Ogataea angusta]KAG7845836.1 hypothetical protein KL940_004881 [Ogataea angusta]